MNLSDLKINKSWTLFLDRDGIINRRRVDDYVKYWEEFEFLPGFLEAISRLNTIFGTVVVVSNQQGIGKGVMSDEAINDIHQKMVAEIRRAGGDIHGIYYCPSLERDDHPCRKPDTGMALQAQRDIPRIDLSKSIMVGDSESDMEFGRRLGMVNVLIIAEPDHMMMEEVLFDFIYPDLLSFSKGLLIV